MQKYQFGYDAESSPAGGWGQLSLVIPPTAPPGCTISSYASGCSYFAYSYEHGEGQGFTGALPGNRVLAKQRTWIEDQTNQTRTDSWSYSYASLNGNTYYTTTTNPDNGGSRTYFTRRVTSGSGRGTAPSLRVW